MGKGVREFLDETVSRLWLPGWAIGHLEEQEMEPVGHQFSIFFLRKFIAVQDFVRIIMQGKVQEAHSETGIQKYRIRTPFCGHLSPRTAYSGQSAREVSGNTAYEGLFVDTCIYHRAPDGQVALLLHVLVAVDRIEHRENSVLLHRRIVKRVIQSEPPSEMRTALHESGKGLLCLNLFCVITGNAYL